MAGFMKTAVVTAASFALFGTASAHALSIVQTPYWSISGAGEGIVITNCDNSGSCSLDIEIACRGQGIGALVNIYAFGMNGAIPYANDQVDIVVDGFVDRRQFTIGSYENGNTVLQFEILPGDPLLTRLAQGRDYEIIASERQVQSGIFGANEAINAFVDGCGWRASYPNLGNAVQSANPPVPQNNTGPDAIVTMLLECGNEPRLHGLGAEMWAYSDNEGFAQVKLPTFVHNGSSVTPPTLNNDRQFGKSFHNPKPATGFAGVFWTATFANERKRDDGVAIMDVNIKSPNVGLDANCVAINTGVIEQ